MLEKIDSSSMGKSNNDWLKSIHHFSFGDYYNPERNGFGVLKVVNDDIVKSQEGFDFHPHKNMEIISYVVNGKLTHKDNIGNESTVERGETQYMSAGKGIFHSEYNNNDEKLRFLQIWIEPDKKGHNVNYGDYKFDWKYRKNKWFHLVSQKDGLAPIKINQDVNIYVIELETEKQIDCKVEDDRQAYLIQIEGKSNINNINFKQRDALKIIEEEICIKALLKSHILVVEMKKA